MYFIAFFFVTIFDSIHPYIIKFLWIFIVMPNSFLTINFVFRASGGSCHFSIEINKKNESFQSSIIFFITKLNRIHPEKSGRERERMENLSLKHSRNQNEWMTIRKHLEFLLNDTHKHSNTHRNNINYMQKFNEVKNKNNIRQNKRWPTSTCVANIWSFVQSHIDVSHLCEYSIWTSPFKKKKKVNIALIWSSLEMIFIHVISFHFISFVPKFRFLFSIFALSLLIAFPS